MGLVVSLVLIVEVVRLCCLTLVVSVDLFIVGIILVFVLGFVLIVGFCCLCSSGVLFGVLWHYWCFALFVTLCLKFVGRFDDLVEID